MCWTCRRWQKTKSASEMLDGHELPSLEAGGISPHCFSFTRFIEELCLLKKTINDLCLQFENYQVIT